MKLASYATPLTKSLGRIVKEENLNDQFPFLTDRNRIIHSMAFRRLEYKTQVFVNHVGDHYRTRLTHSLEVAQVASTIARMLNLNEDLTETIALCHDLGHPPFGHAGEDGLNEAAKKFGGFNHNFQTLRILTKLEQRHVEFDGLNLTWETLEGTIKHNGPITTPIAKLPKIVQEISGKADLLLDQYPSLEAQISGLADDIAYCNHDIDDGIRAGMFEIEDLNQIKLIGKIYKEVNAAYPKINRSKLLNEIIRRIVKHMTQDLVFETQRNIKHYKISKPEDVRNQPSAIVSFSKEVEEMRNLLKAFLMKNVYRNYLVNRMSEKGKLILKDLFNRFLEKPYCLPTEWALKTENKSEEEIAKVIIDFIAGMTDRYAIEEHKKLFDPSNF
jgi:dGTPase